MRKIVPIIVGILFVLATSVCFATDVTEQTEEENELGLSSLTIISEISNRAQIKLYAALTIDDAQKLWDDFFILKNETVIRDIDIYIASPGGTTFGGFSIIACLERAKKDGFNITAYGTALIGSMAIPIFATCEYRITYTSTIFMVHPATIQNAGAMQEADMESQAAFMTMTKDVYTAAIAKYTKLSQEEWLTHCKKDTWFSAKQALEWGLCDRVD